MKAAVFSSIRADNLQGLLNSVLRASTVQPPPEGVLHDLLSLAAALGDKKTLARLLRDVTTPHQGNYAAWQMAALGGLLESLEQRGQSLEEIADKTMRFQLGRMFTQARATAADSKANESERRLALSLLGREKQFRVEDVNLLGKLLVAQNSASLQAVAVAALGRIADEHVPEVLTADWNAHSPALKGQILDVVLSRDAWQLRLLDQIEKKTVPAAEVDTARRQRLLAHRHESIRTRAAELFDGAIGSDRRKVLDEYKEAVKMAGNRRRGKIIFGKSCSICHRLEGDGHALGPDLQALPNKSPLYLLTEVLDPNRNVDTRYLSYVAVTRSGRTFTGLLTSESATSITLRGQAGKEEVLLRSELDELRSTGKSLMPEGLEKELSKQDVSDVIAYLNGQRPPG